MLDTVLLANLYPELTGIKVKILGDIEYSLFDALCIGAYSVTHMSGYFDNFPIEFINHTELTEAVHNKVQEFLYRDFGQTNELTSDTYTDTDIEITKGLCVCWISKDTDESELTEDIQSDIDRTFNYTKEYKDLYDKWRWKLFCKK